MAKKHAAPSYPVNPALEAAVIAHAEDDTPRLVYADWLDENGDPDRAAFIRTQIALWNKNPADEDYVDLVERKRELLPALARRFLKRDKGSPILFGGYWTNDEGDGTSTVWHRGFPYLDSDDGSSLPERGATAPELAARLRETTVRGFAIGDDPPGSLATFLASPEGKLLSCLRVRSGALATVFASEVRSRLQWLIVDARDGSEYLPVLAKAPACERLRRFACGKFGGEPAAIRAALAGEWAANLNRVSIDGGAGEVAVAVLESLAKLPHLHTLGISLGPSGLDALRNVTFPNVAELTLGGDSAAGTAKRLAKAKFPQLVELAFGSLNFTDAHLATLCRSPLFARLRSFSVHTYYLGPKSFASIAKSRAAKTLRVLDIRGPHYGADHLAAIAAPGALPKLVTLNLPGSGKPHASKEVDEKLAGLFAAAEWPDLRRLDLFHWPLGNASARAIANNPNFANLRALNLGYSAINTDGLAALVSSPHLQNLVCLCLVGCTSPTGLEALRDPAVLPRLADCRLPSGMSEAAKRELIDARPGVCL